MTDRAVPNLPSRDLIATATFYGGFGFSELHRDENWLVLRRGDLQIEFFRKDDLDPALIRPGRFDRSIYFGLPGRRARADIVAYYLGKKAHAADLDGHAAVDVVAGMTFGYSPAALERLECDVETAEGLLAVETFTDETELAIPSWEPPAMRGPLPSDLEPRARLVLERQLAVAYLLTERLTRTSKHRELTDRLRNDWLADVPVYVDLKA